MRVNVISNDTELSILLYGCDISQTSLATWLVESVTSGALETVSNTGGITDAPERDESYRLEPETQADATDIHDIVPEHGDSLLNQVRTRFECHFVDGTTVFSYDDRTNWNCIRLLKRAGVISSFSFAQLENHVISGNLTKGAEIRLPDFFADILKEQSWRKDRLEALKGSIKYHLSMAYLVGDRFPVDGKFVFSNAISSSEARTLNELLTGFVRSADYYLNVPKPPCYLGKDLLHTIPLVPGMSTWPDSTIPVFDDIRLMDWRAIQWSTQKVQCRISDKLDQWKIDYRIYGDICVVNLRDFCLKGAKEPEFGLSKRVTNW